jgi:hypothetical protein
LPVHVLIESPAAVQWAFDIAAHPRVQSMSFGLMDFVSAHGGAIPAEGMGIQGQFTHPLVLRAKRDVIVVEHRLGWIMANAGIDMSNVEQDGERVLLLPEDPDATCRLLRERLADLADANDRAAAQTSLNATLRHWRDGQPIEARRWIQQQLDELAPLAAELALTPWLEPLHAVLERGNQATRWLQRHRSGESISAILSTEIEAMAEQELAILGSASKHTDSLSGPLG